MPHDTSCSSSRADVVASVMAFVLPCILNLRTVWHRTVLLSNARPSKLDHRTELPASSAQCAGIAKWAPFGLTCMKLCDLKLVIITYTINEHNIAMRTVKNAFKLVAQLVSQRRSLSWVSRCKCENVAKWLPKIPSLQRTASGCKISQRKVLPSTGKKVFRGCAVSKGRPGAMVGCWGEGSGGSGGGLNSWVFTAPPTMDCCHPPPTTHPYTTAMP